MGMHLGHRITPLQRRETEQCSAGSDEVRKELREKPSSVSGVCKQFNHQLLVRLRGSKTV